MKKKVDAFNFRQCEGEDNLPPYITTKILGGKNNSSIGGTGGKGKVTVLVK